MGPSIAGLVVRTVLTTLNATGSAKDKRLAKMNMSIITVIGKVPINLVRKMVIAPMIVVPGEEDAAVMHKWDTYAILNLTAPPECSRMGSEVFSPFHC